MQNIYEVLKEYLELKINNLKQDKSEDILKLYNAINLFLSTPKNELNKLDASIHDIICNEILKNDQNLVKSYRLLCVYSSYLDNPFLSNDPQIVEANEYYKIITDRLSNLLRTLEIQIYKLKRKDEESQAIISIYENYLSLFDVGGVKKPLELDELWTFFEFIKSSTLDKEVILNLITEFSKYNITYQLNKQKLVISSRIKEIDTKISKITKEISEEIPTSSALEIPKEIPKRNLTLEEQSIVNKISIILSELKGVNGDSSLLELLDGEFTISGRKEIYEASGIDKWKLIYEDIIQNLLPNLENNKDNILAIFEYIINTYGKKEEQPEKVQLDIEYDDILTTESVRLDKYLELSKKSRFIFDSYDDDKKRLIDIAYGYLQIGDEVGLNSLKLDISFTDIVFMKNLDKMKKLINDWKMLTGLTDEEIILFGIDEYKESIKETADSIVSILDKLDKDYEKIENKSIVTPPEEIVTNSNDQENYIIFLNDENGVPIIFNDVKDILKTDNLQEVCDVFSKVYSMNYFEFLSERIQRVVLPVRNPKMYEIRKGGARVAIIQVPLSENNRKNICQNFKNGNKINLVLVVSFGFKHTDSKNQNVCDKFNRIYDTNINQIMQIFNLFSTDFNDQSFEEAQKMLLDGIETVNQIEKISKNREKKGV